jgi:L-asparaginase/Glu-tRNA(Gln) amidotransferase subunit D
VNKVKKIIVITTGGTIGSLLSPDVVSVDPSTQKIAHELDIAKNTLGYEVDVLSPINKNSETLAPTDWLAILHSIQIACASDADGIVITHGTDTLVYTVAAVLAFSGLWSKKICFTGAYYAPDHPDSDASLSLLAALAFAASDQVNKGVYVAFRTDQHNNHATLFHGFDVKPMGFDELIFSALYNQSVASYTPQKSITIDAAPSAAPHPQLDHSQFPDKDSLNQAQSKVALITLYPGIDKSTLKALTEGRDIVVIQLYHCGSGPFGEGYSDLVEHIQSYSCDTTFLMAALPSKYITTPYESTRVLIKAGGFIYNDIQPHFLYVFSLLALASGETQKQIQSQLAQWQVR